ncbi:response regulator [uncultured Methanospirillum sp.]|uniref:ATP-binding response regulator n=1 Tax=uncultured Methanospirillum sp. TaxID=262503 RepID=UPI0029C8B9B4|nr:response regulator [uncultured Methanospirillum sp.]
MVYLIASGRLSGGEHTGSRQASIYIVEDNPAVCDVITLTLQDLGFHVPGCSASGEDAIEKIGCIMPDLVLMDISLAGEMDGIEAATRVRDEFSIPVVFLTSNDDETLNQRITRSGSYGYLTKPYNGRELKLTIDIAIRTHQLDQRLRRSEEFYRTLADAFDDGIMLFSPDAEIRYLNPGACLLLQTLDPGGSPPLPGTSLLRFNPAIFRDEILRSMDMLLSTGKTVRRVVLIPPRDHDTWLDLHLLPISENGSSPSGMLLIYRDVTLRVEFENEVKKTGLARIEENMEVFQILNDQIRNPLQVIAGLVDLEESPFRPRYVEQIKAIDQVIQDFDTAWVQSEKVRRFLLTHYGHGIYKNKL